jgi:hypothetical protein
MGEHRWSGWPGAWCLDCGKSDPRETALADGSFEVDYSGMPFVKVKSEDMECSEPNSRRHDPYYARSER